MTIISLKTDQDEAVYHLMQKIWVVPITNSTWEHTRHHVVLHDIELDFWSDAHQTYQQVLISWASQKSWASALSPFPGSLDRHIHMPFAILDNLATPKAVVKARTEAKRSQESHWWRGFWLWLSSWHDVTNRRYYQPVKWDLCCGLGGWRCFLVCLLAGCWWQFWFDFTIVHGQIISITSMIPFLQMTFGSNLNYLSSMLMLV